MLHRFPALNRIRTAMLGGLVCALGLAASMPAAHAAGLLESHFDYLGTEDGLAQNSINAILQDSQGLLWFATQDGLHRYDGYNFKIYRNAGDGKGLGSSFIQSLYMDSHDVLWIGSYGNGLYRMQLPNGKIERVSAADPDTLDFAHASVWSIEADASGALWIASSAGLAMLPPDGKRLQPVPTPDAARKQMRSPDIWDLHQDRFGEYWVAGNGVLAHFSGPNAKWNIVDLHAHFPDMPAGHISANVIREDADGRLFVGMSGALVSIGPKRKQYRHRVAAPALGDWAHGPLIQDMLLDEKGGLWIGTLGDGLVYYDPATGATSHYRHDPSESGSLAANDIASLYLDRTGLLWIGTQQSGLNIFNPATRAFAHYHSHPADKNSLTDNTVWGFAKTDPNIVWVATNQGLNRVDLENNQVQRFLHDPKEPHSLGTNYVSCVAVVDGQIWAGGHGLHRYRGKGRGFDHYWIDPEHPSALNNVLLNFLPLGDQRFLVATYAGMYLYDTGTKRRRPLPEDDHLHPDMPSAAALDFARDSDGTIWIGTERGLLRWRPGDAKAVDVMTGPLAGLHGHAIQDLAFLADGWLALSTDDGLALTHPRDPHGIEWYDTRTGLPNNTIYATRQDRSGKLWISSNAGLTRLDLDTGNVLNYDRHDGLQADEFNAGAALVDDSGRMYFGGINGFNVFNPERLEKKQTPPGVVITSTRVSDRALDIGGPVSTSRDVRLGWRQDIFSAEFAATDYASPKTNQFKYRLPPLYPQWTNLKDSHRAVFTNLPGGDYTLEVKAANREGVWSDKITQLHLHIAPKPWRTWWAYSLYGIALLAMLALYLRYQRQRVLAQHRAGYEKKQRRWIQSLYELAGNLSQTLNRGEIADFLFQHLKKHVDFEYAAFYGQVEHRMEPIKIQAGEGAEVVGLRDFCMNQHDWIAELRHRSTPMAMPGAELADSGQPAWLAASHLLVMPLESRGGQFLLLILGRHGAAFDENDQKSVAAYANQAMLALDKASLFAQVEALATRDSLTGLFNRRHVFERGELDFERCARYHRPFSVLMVDFDNFKALNDKHGHDAGDVVLRELSRVLAAQLRGVDIIGRYGGEEFIVCLPETGAEMAANVAERLRVCASEQLTRYESLELRVTVSVGLATVERAEGDLKALVVAADKALYQAKAAGRNTVRQARPELAES